MAFLDWMLQLCHVPDNVKTRGNHGLSAPLVHLRCLPACVDAVKLVSNRYSSYSFSAILTKLGRHDLCGNVQKTETAFQNFDFKIFGNLKKKNLNQQPTGLLWFVVDHTLYGGRVVRASSLLLRWWVQFPVVYSLLLNLCRVVLTFLPPLPNCIICYHCSKCGTFIDVASKPHPSACVNFREFLTGEETRTPGVWTVEQQCGQSWATAARVSGDWRAERWTDRHCHCVKLPLLWRLKMQKVCHSWWLGTSLIHDFTAVTFSVKLAVFREKRPFPCFHEIPWNLIFREF